ncbi:hypothetical protein HDU77_010070 [Chytriomyces hyalinus]|nr:hypothetical protein HDU77_010070 [Chytriomyces hyalinus]
MDLIAQYKQLVQLERQAASEEESASVSISGRIDSLARAGRAVKGVSVVQARTGLGGKTILALAQSDKDNAFALFKTGDNVAIAKSGADAVTVAGVVSRLMNGTLHVALADVSDTDLFSITQAEKVAVAKVASDVPFRRMLDSLAQLEAVITNAKGANSPISTDLMHVLLGTGVARPSFGVLAGQSISYLNPFLNPSQQSAVARCLAANQLALIHGPPGTGKTETVVELVRQLVARGDRVLLCGPSNISVDTLAARLTPHLNSKLSMTRIGHPSRVRREQVLDHVLDIRVRSSDEGKIANDVRDEMDKTLAAIAKSKKKSERRGLYDELKKLRVELREREKKVVSDVISTSNVIVATLSGCGSFVLKGQVFDSVVIDESSQAIEAVKSEGSSAAKQKVTTLSASDTSSNLPQSLSCTLFDRMLAIYGADIKCLLDTQYRMNEIIMRFPSDHLYGGKLKAHESVSNHLLCHLPGVQETDESTSAFTLLNTSMCAFRETAPILDTSISHLLASESLQNMGEATLIESHVQKLVAAGVSTTQISVITPYSGQVRLLQSQLLSTYPDLEIGTVDSFQGAEKEAVILSLVRSNEKGEIGFLGDVRRLNVAVTRARRHLCIVFDEGMKRGNAFLDGMVRFVEENADMVYVEGFTTNAFRDTTLHSTLKQIPPSPAMETRNKESSSLLGLIRNDTAFTDVDLIFEGGAVLSAHAVVLASTSDYCKEDLSAKWTANAFESLEVVDDEITLNHPEVNTETAKIVLDYLYLGDVEIAAPLASSVIVFANEILVFSLVQKCVDILVKGENLSVENALAFYFLCDRIQVIQNKKSIGLSKMLQDLLLSLKSGREVLAQMSGRDIQTMLLFESFEPLHRWRILIAWCKASLDAEGDLTLESGLPENFQIEVASKMIEPLLPVVELFKISPANSSLMEPFQGLLPESMQHVLIFHLKGAARSGGKQWKATHKRSLRAIKQPLPGSLKTFVASDPILLFHGERDIWIERNLHKARDGKPNTLTLIKLKTGTIFGGYSATAWTSQSPRVCIESFAFSISPSGAFLRLPFRNSGAGILGGPYYEPMSGTTGSTYKLFVNEHSLTATTPDALAFSSNRHAFNGCVYPLCSSMRASGSAGMQANGVSNRIARNRKRRSVLEVEKKKEIGNSKHKLLFIHLLSRVQI